MESAPERLPESGSSQLGDIARVPPDLSTALETFEIEQLPGLNTDSAWLLRKYLNVSSIGALRRLTLAQLRSIPKMGDTRVSNILSGLREFGSEMSEQGSLAEELELPIEVVDLMRRLPIGSIPDLDTRCRNVLKRMNVQLVGELLTLSPYELLSVRHFGKKSFDNLRAGLRSLADKVPTGEFEFESDLDEQVSLAEELELPIEVVDLMRRLPISSIPELDARCRNVLEKMNVELVGELLTLTLHELLSARNFGQKSFDSLRSGLRSLADNMPDDVVPTRPYVDHNWPLGSLGDTLQIDPTALGNGRFPTVLLPGLGKPEIEYLFESGIRTVDELARMPRMAAAFRGIAHQSMRTIGRSLEKFVIGERCVKEEQLSTPIDQVPMMRGEFRRIRKTGVRTAAELADRAFDQVTLRSTASNVAFWKRVAQVGRFSQSISAELNEALDQLDERERLIVVGRFGIRDGEDQKLEQLGRELNVTRERVRQIQVRAVRRLNALPIRNYVVELAARTLSLADKCTEVATSLDDLVRQLAANAVPVQREDLPLIQFLIDLGWVDVPPGIQVDLWSALAVIKGKRQLSEVTQVASKFARNVGAAHIASISRTANAPEDECREILLHSGFTEVDSWFLLPQPAEPFLSTVRRMHIYCGDCLELRTIRNGIRKKVSRRAIYREMPLPPAEVIGSVLSTLPEFIVRNRFSRWCPAGGLDQLVELSGASAAMITIFDASVRVLGFPEIHDRMIEAGYSHVTAAVVLGSHPLIRKIEYSLYARIGQDISLADVQEARDGRKQIAADSDVRYTRKGTIIFEVNLGGFADGGVLTATGLELFSGQWPVEVEGSEVGKVTIHNSFARGLSSAFQLLGVRRGDRIRLEFDTARHVVSAEVSRRLGGKSFGT